MSSGNSHLSSADPNLSGSAGSETTDDLAPRPPSRTGCTEELTTSWIVDGTPEAVREALADMMMALECCGTHEELVHTTEMVLAETLNNVVEHAYAGQTGGWIEIEIVCNCDTLRVTVSDHGAPMPGLEPPPGRLQDVSVPTEALPEGGFGWFLIRQMTYDLAYRREVDRNILSYFVATEPLLA